MHSVQLFDGTHFPTWKYRMDVILEEYELLDFITTKAQERDELVIKGKDTTQENNRKEKEMEKVRKRKRKCKSLIVSRISNSQNEYVQGHDAPKAI